jgi:very-short-patch-repair endonuclease
MTKVVFDKRRRNLADIQRELAQNGEIMTDQMTVTKTENRLGQALIDSGLEVVAQFELDGRSFDLKILTYPILIEVDGSIHATFDKRQNDYRKDRYAQRRGYKILRFTNDEINDDKQIGRIITEVKSMIYRVGHSPREIHVYPLSIPEQIKLWWKKHIKHEEVRITAKITLDSVKEVPK